MSLSSIIGLSHKNFQEEQLNSSTFPVFPLSCRHPATLRLLLINSVNSDCNRQYFTGNYFGSKNFNIKKIYHSKITHDLCPWDTTATKEECVNVLFLSFPFCRQIITVRVRVLISTTVCFFL